jgi:hypothetical protein
VIKIIKRTARRSGKVVGEPNPEAAININRMAENARNVRQIHGRNNFNP